MGGETAATGGETATEMTTEIAETGVALAADLGTAGDGHHPVAIHEVEVVAGVAVIPAATVVTGRGNPVRVRGMKNSRMAHPGDHSPGNKNNMYITHRHGLRTSGLLNPDCFIIPIPPKQSVSSLLPLIKIIELNNEVTSW